MTPRQRMLAIMVSLALLFFVFELVRRRKLREEYSFLWIVIGIMILTFAVYDKALFAVTRFFGIVLPTSTLFFFGIIFMTLISIHFSVKISQLTGQVIKLTQEVALIKKKPHEDAYKEKT